MQNADVIVVRLQRINVGILGIVARNGGTAVAYHPVKRATRGVGVEKKKPLKTAPAEKLSVLHIGFAGERIRYGSGESAQPAERQSHDERQNGKKSHHSFAPTRHC